MAKIDYGLLAIGIVLSILGLFVVFDVFSAVGAEACVGGAAWADCYPWGAEGPASESWQYQSKGMYIATGLVIAILPIFSTASIAFKGIRGLQLTSSHRITVGTANLITLILIFA